MCWARRRLRLKLQIGMPSMPGMPTCEIGMPGMPSHIWHAWHADHEFLPDRGLGLSSPISKRPGLTWPGPFLPTEGMRPNFTCPEYTIYYSWRYWVFFHAWAYEISPRLLTWLLGWFLKLIWHVRIKFMPIPLILKKTDEILVSKPFLRAKSRLFWSYCRQLSLGSLRIDDFRTTTPLDCVTYLLRMPVLALAGVE